MNKIEIPKPNGKEKPRLSAISVHYLVMISSSLIKKLFCNTIITQSMIHFKNWVRVNLSVKNSEPYLEGFYGAMDAEHRFYAWFMLILSSDLYFKYIYTWINFFMSSVSKWNCRAYVNGSHMCGFSFLVFEIYKKY